jgi:hypothetical protein
MRFETPGGVRIANLLAAASSAVVLSAVVLMSLMLHCYHLCVLLLDAVGCAAAAGLYRMLDLLNGCPLLLDIVRLFDWLQGHAGQWRDCEPGH